MCVVHYHVIYVFVYVKLFKGKYLHENDSWKTFKHRSVKNIPAKYWAVKAYFSLFICLMSLVFLEIQLKAQVWLRMNTFTLSSLCRKPIAYIWHCIFYLIQIDVVVPTFHITFIQWSFHRRSDIMTDNNRNKFSKEFESTG